MKKLLTTLALALFPASAFANPPAIPPSAPVTSSGVRSFGYQIGAAIGDSLIDGAANGASPYNFSLVDAFAFRSLGDFSVAGTRTDQILTQVPSACAVRPNFILADGGVNDIGQSVSESTIEANQIAIWSAISGCGAQPIDLGSPPTNNSGNVAGYVLNETWRRLYTWKHGIKHVDGYRSLANNTGAYQSGVNDDAIHWNTVGANIIGANITSALRTTAPYAPPLLAMTDTSSQQIGFIDNAISFGGAGGTSLPSGWTTIGGGCASYYVTAAAPSDIGTGGLGNWLRCTLSAAGSNVGFHYALGYLPSPFAVGHSIAVGFCIRWVDASQSLTITAGITKFGGFTTMYQQKGGATGESQCWYGQGVIPSGATQIDFAFEATGTGYFEVAAPTMVDLTVLGQYHSLLP